jgi:hypothetical protein
MPDLYSNWTAIWLAGGFRFDSQGVKDSLVYRAQTFTGTYSVAMRPNHSTMLFIQRVFNFFGGGGEESGDSMMLDTHSI